MENLGGGLVTKSCLTLATLWTVACQAPLSMGFLQRSFTDCSDGKESVRNMGNLGSTPGLGRSPGEGNGNPLQYSCLENAMDRRTLAGYSCVCKELDMT